MKNFLIILGIFLLVQILKGCVSETTSTNPATKATESRYNDMNPADYYTEMNSNDLEYADIAWHAQNTYGWNCSEVTNLDEPVSTSGKELKDSYLISQIVGTYSIATCSSGVKLRVYPRTDTYPIITNINGGFE